MPNAHYQVTRDDFQAPKGKYRIIQEEMSDGQRNIIADFHDRSIAQWALAELRKKYKADVFTICDDDGPMT